jgi:hypothetical protein
LRNVRNIATSSCKMAQPLVLAEGEELTFQQFAPFLEGGLREMPGLGVLEIEADGVLDRGRDDLDDANLAGGFPAVDRGGRGGPLAGAERALDPLATQGSLDPDRAIAAGPSTPLGAVGTGLGVPAEEPQTAGRHGPSYAHAAIGEPSVADAICDRLIHRAQRLTLKGPTMRDPATRRPPKGTS